MESSEHNGTCGFWQGDFFHAVLSQYVHHYAFTNLNFCDVTLSCSMSFPERFFSVRREKDISWKRL